jgi:crotonobetainyl-CoA:carnitine CoA-transferase CaiB-like acyl-CoA transferase
MPKKNTPPLKGLRVVDFTRVVAGPFCTMILGDLGAEIIKVEMPGKGDDTRDYPPFQKGESSYFMSINRNKKSVTLNLKKDEGRKIAYKIIEKSDVVIENFRPGVSTRLGIDYQTIKPYNPKIIYASISSFGQTGPYSMLPGYDLLIQGVGGLMSITGEPGKTPVRIGVAITDIGAGMWTVIAILAALNYRGAVGEGQYIDVSMLDGCISWMTYSAGNYFATGKVPKKLGTAHPSIVPFQAFVTRDDKYILIACGNNRLFNILCKGIGMNELTHNPQFNTNITRVKNREKLISILEEKFLERTRDDWIQTLQSLGFPCGPIYEMDEIFRDPQVRHRDMHMNITHPKVGVLDQIGPVLKFSESPCFIELPPPLLGQHTEEVLHNLLKYSKNTIRRLEEEGVC